MIKLIGILNKRDTPVDCLKAGCGGSTAEGKLCIPPCIPMEKSGWVHESLPASLNDQLYSEISSTLI